MSIIQFLTFTMYVIKCHQNHYTKKSDELVGGELFHCIVTMCELKHQSQ